MFVKVLFELDTVLIQEQINRCSAVNCKLLGIIDEQAGIIANLLVKERVSRGVVFIEMNDNLWLYQYMY